MRKDWALKLKPTKWKLLEWRGTIPGRKIIVSYVDEEQKGEKQELREGKEEDEEKKKEKENKKQEELQKKNKKKEEEMEEKMKTNFNSIRLCVEDKL